MEVNIENYWDNVYDIPVQGIKTGFQPTDHRSYERYKYFNFILQNLESKKIMDIGCGRNPFMLKYYPIDILKYEFYGIDVSENALKNIPDHPHIHKIKSNLSSLDFEDNSFDFIYSFGTLMYVENYKHVISEIFRVLKSGGHFFGFENIVHVPIFKKNIGTIHNLSKIVPSELKTELMIESEISFFKKTYSPFRHSLDRVFLRWFENSPLYHKLIIKSDEWFISLFGNLSKKLDARSIFFIAQKK